MSRRPSVRARGRHDAGRRRDDDRAVALAPGRSGSGGACGSTGATRPIRRLLHLARWVALYVVVNQIAYFVIIVFNGRVPGGRVRGLLAGVHLLLAAARDRRGVDLHRAAAEPRGTLDRPRPRRRARALLAGAPRHRGGDAARRRRLRGARGTDRRAARELRPDDRGRHRSCSVARSRRSPSGCRSSRRSSCSHVPSTRRRTPGPRRSPTSPSRW